MVSQCLVVISKCLVIISKCLVSVSKCLLVVIKCLFRVGPTYFGMGGTCTLGCVEKTKNSLNKLLSWNLAVLGINKIIKKKLKRLMKFFLFS